MHLKAVFGKALAWSVAGEWSRQAVGFVVYGTIARLVAPAAFGLIALASAFIVLGQVLVDQGMSDAIVQRKDLDEGHLDTAFWLTLLMGACLAGVGLIAARPLAAAFHQPRLVSVLSWMLLALPLAALASIQQAILRRAMNFRALAIRSLVATAVGGAVGITLGLMGFGVWALVAQTLATSVTGILTLWTVSDWRPGFAVSRRHFTELASFGWNVGGAGVLAFVSRRSDDLIVGFFLGPVALGYYTMAYRVFELMQGAFVSVTAAVSYPMFSKLQTDGAGVAALFLNLTQFVSVVTFPIAIGISLLAPELVAVAFGSHWGPSAAVLRVLAPASVVIALFVFNGIVLKTMGKAHWVFRLAALDAVGNVVAFLIFVRWGIVAVGAGFVVRAFVLVPFRVWLLPRVIPLKVADFFTGLIPATAGTALMTIAILLGRTLTGPGLSTGARLIVLGLCGFVTYALTIFVMAPSLWRRGVDVLRVIVAPVPADA